MGGVAIWILGGVCLAVILWMRLLKPILSDRAWRRQGKRIEQATARRVARHRERVRQVPPPP